MLKRLCDICETEISDDENFFRIKSYEVIDSNYGNEEVYDLCKECFTDLKEVLANNN